MSGERLLRPADGLDPVQRLWRQLPPQWRGPVIGPDIEGWDSITENGDRRIDLTGLPDPFPAELAWMAHWQAADGTRCSVLAMNQLANILHRAIREGHPFPRLDARHGLGNRRSAAGLVLCHTLGSADAQGKAAPGCASSSGSPAWPCSPAAPMARGGRWMTGIPGAT